jgi:hypothetical protein
LRWSSDLWPDILPPPFQRHINRPWPQCELISIPIRDTRMYWKCLWNGKRVNRKDTSLAPGRHKDTSRDISYTFLMQVSFIQSYF